MTKDEIEKLAVEAGWPLFAIQMLSGTEDEKRLERFAALVAAAEREACAQICDWSQHGHYGTLAFLIRARGNA